MFRMNGTSFVTVEWNNVKRKRRYIVAIPVRKKPLNCSTNTDFYLRESKHRIESSSRRGPADNAAATLVVFAFEYKVRTPHNYSKVVKKGQRSWHVISIIFLLFYNIERRKKKKPEEGINSTRRNNSNHK